MNEINKNESLNVNCENEIAEVTAKKVRVNSGKNIKLIAFILLICMLGFEVWVILDSVNVASRAASDAYKSEKESLYEDIYDDFYQRSYEISERNHHVSNEITISIESLKEREKLEVLTVSEVEYVTPDDDEGNWITNIKNSVTVFFSGNVISWLEVPGYGVFTVDLKAAEFIIDNERQYVLVRVPEPKLSEFTIDYENVELLNFESTGIFKGTAEVGVNLAREQLQSAELTMLQRANNNQEFYQSARESAKTMLESLIKELNPELTDLIVDVEFYD